MISKLKKQISIGYLHEEIKKPCEVGYFILPKRKKSLIKTSKSELKHKIEQITEKSLVFILPTLLERLQNEQFSENITKTLKQLIKASNFHISIKFIVFIGIQCEFLKNKRDEEYILMLTNKILEKLCITNNNLNVMALLLSKNGKVYTLNKVFDLTRNSKIKGFGWIDDDVTFSENCWQKLVSCFVDRNCKGAVGPSKIGQRKNKSLDKTIFHLKKQIGSAVDYPHGCGILVESELVNNGIPERYICDDGFVCFEIIKKYKNESFKYIKLLKGAFCYYYVGGSIKRIRRILINHIVYLSDYPIEVSLYFFNNMLFPNLFTKNNRFEVRQKNEKLYCKVIKYIYFFIFIAICLELVVRGKIKRPINKINWS